MSSGLLIHDEFVAYFPALGRALGSVEDAVLVQALWFRRDRDGSETTIAAGDLAQLVGMAQRTAERRLAKLKKSGVLSSRRASSYDPTSVWRVHLEVLNSLGSEGQNGDDVTANMAVTLTAKTADTMTAKMAATTYIEELKEDNKNVGVPADAETTPAPIFDFNSEETAERPEVEALCVRLADRIEANGSKRPNITKRWLDAARLMLDRDGRAAEDIAAAIDWSQQDSFWQSNILSMPKLRDKYDTLRLQASHTASAPRRDRQADILEAEMQAARAADASQGSRSPFGVIGR
ncbi:hypothetical protein [Glutamicibacter arilaitensis]|uniref:hypothetical protein n=1 Tax=Glutamicibacter arilaitensis TaxID=256701 RepID=UPI003F929F47